MNRHLKLETGMEKSVQLLITKEKELNENFLLFFPQLMQKVNEFVAEKDYSKS
jgi:acyl carrier protein phosphodiesterase